MTSTIRILINRTHPVDPRRPAISLMDMGPVGHWQNLCEVQREQFTGEQTDSVSFWRVKVPNGHESIGKIKDGEVMWVACVREAPGGRGWLTNISQAQVRIEIRGQWASIYFDRFTAAPHSTVVEDKVDEPSVIDNYGFVKLDVLATPQLLLARRILEAGEALPHIDTQGITEDDALELAQFLRDSDGLPQDAKTTSVLQYRVCGENPTRGSWQGVWCSGEPDRNERYEAEKKYAPRGKTWFEYRRITTVITDERTEEVEAR